MNVAIEDNLGWETIDGAIKVLTEVIELSHPELLGRTYALEQLMGPVLDTLGYEEEWEYPLAARLAVLGRVILMSHLPDQTEYLAVAPLSVDEIEVARHLVSYVPRFDRVAEIISSVGEATGEIKDELGSRDEFIANGASITRAILLAFGALQEGKDLEETLKVVRDTMPLVDDRIIDTLRETDFASKHSVEQTAYNTEASLLKEGMVLAQDLVLENGVKLLTGHQTLNRTLIARLQSLSRKELLNGPIRVYLN